MFGRDSNTLCREAIPFYLTFSAFKSFNLLQHQTRPRQAQPAAHVLENLSELKGQQGKQGLRLIMPEAKVRTNLCFFSCSFILPTRALSASLA